jgi:tetraacyldisaccharide-1-P 4'-kinase
MRKLGEAEELPLESLSDSGAIAFAGIANPAQFLTTLDRLGSESPSLSSRLPLPGADYSAWCARVKS